MLRFVLTVAICLMLFPFAAWAEPALGIPQIVGTLSPERMLPIINRNQAAPAIKTAHYTRMREGEIISNLASSSDTTRIDLAILPTPDSGVRLANEGLLKKLPIAGNAKDGSHWRGEVISLFYDPSVILVRSGAFPDTALPQDRAELVRFLEDHSRELTERVGLVNIGVDSQSYAYAAQDQLRSPLFWRIAQTFGQLQTRIYNSNDEVVEAIQKGSIDLAYNVPLSEIAFSDQAGMTIILPKDYIVSLPWIMVSPSHPSDPLFMESIVQLRQQIRHKHFPSQTFWQIVDRNDLSQTQRVKIGPELLVFLDPIKKTNILDTWFQMVTNQ